MIYSYYDYKTKRCSGLDYAKQQFLGQGKGEIEQFEIYRNRFLYAVKRFASNGDGVKFIEYKICDLDSNDDSCVMREKVYFKEREVSAKQYLKKCLQKPEMKNYIQARIAFRD